jgi:hypothetical protein
MEPEQAHQRYLKLREMLLNGGLKLAHANITYQRGTGSVTAKVTDMTVRMSARDIEELEEQLDNKPDIQL